MSLDINFMNFMISNMVDLRTGKRIGSKVKSLKYVVTNSDTFNDDFVYYCSLILNLELNGGTNGICYLQLCKGECAY